MITVCPQCKATDTINCNGLCVTCLYTIPGGGASEPESTESHQAEPATCEKSARRRDADEKHEAEDAMKCIDCGWSEGFLRTTVTVDGLHDGKIWTCYNCQRNIIPGDGELKPATPTSARRLNANQRWWRHHPKFGASEHDADQERLLLFMVEELNALNYWLEENSSNGYLDVNTKD